MNVDGDTRTGAKPWWQSRVLWFNAIIAALAALEANVHLIQPYLPGNAYSYGVVLLTIGNAGLRVLTTQALGARATPGGSA